MATSEKDGEPNGEHQEHLTILAAGFNAHGQLDNSTKEDIPTFKPLSDDAENLDILFAGWSTTVLTSREHMWSLGHQKFSSTTPQGRPVCAFGDHNGLTGFLDENHILTLATPHPDSAAAKTGPIEHILKQATTEASPTVSLIALAGNERVAATFKQAPDGNLCHIVEFKTVQKFVAWYSDPSNEANYPDKHHMFPGRPKQLLANTASFLVLMEGGEVYSWGDPRHRSLGRSIAGEESTPANEPGVVDALGGLKIVKVACGGWMGAALSEDGAVYLWGAATAPGGKGSIRCLQEAGAGEVALVEIPGEDGEPLDVLDVGVGDEHVAVVTPHPDGNRLYVVGDNSNGQLGLTNTDVNFAEDWTECDGIRNVQRVVCGPLATFAYVRPPT